MTVLSRWDVSEYGYYLRVGEESGRTVFLLKTDVLNPGLPEARGVIEEVRRLRKRVRVARPPQSLIALGAVGRHAHKVRLHAPLHILVELVQPGRGTLEGASLAHVAVDYNTGD